MDIRQSVPRFPTRPIAFVLVVLSALALALTAFYVLRTSASSQPLANDRPVVTACSGLGPDAQDRCEKIMAAQQPNPEATHGH